MPLQDFIKLVKGEYFGAWQECKTMSQKRTINWKNEGLYPYENKIRNIMDFGKFKPHRYHIL
ncbi:hypothetical protein Patl1_15814 [Pistacia atlantica]|uniref:Uncharacterized protein n=1 Tax=Pistacia atlantica TaxID=434234 RepID=A0ACC1B846_9ROSI|nr:hypothetical protein Patl1_15814 [Pistacia atlantica]